jgi:pimeloyl-ACP methyl ester carboxylesterase
MRAAERLRDLQRPVLLLWPRRLPYFPFEQAQRWLRVLSDARLVEVPDSHAFVCHDQPEFAADRIVRFIDHDVSEAQT